MKQEDKLKKMCKDFSLLSEEKQDYILGILQALVFADSVDESHNQAVDEPLNAHSS